MIPKKLKEEILKCDYDDIYEVFRQVSDETHKIIDSETTYIISQNGKDIISFKYHDGEYGSSLYIIPTDIEHGYHESFLTNIIKNIQKDLHYIRSSLDYDEIDKVVMPNGHRLIVRKVKQEINKTY